MATSGRPGAVHLSLPKDVLAQGISAHVAVYVEDSCKSWPAYRTRPPADAVDRVSRLIHESQRPVIVAGGGVVSSGAHTSLSDLAHRLGIPVVTTINGKGAIAENTALSVGVIGANGGRPSANRIVQEADLVLFLGCKSNYVDTDSWRVPPLDDPPKIVQIDIDTSEIGNNYPVDEGLCGDVRLVLADLLASLGGGGVLPVNRDRWLRYVSETKAADQARMAELADCTDVPLSPYRVVKALQQELPEDAILICDPGTPTPIMAAQFELPRAGRSFISPRGQGGLGYAIPGAVGARLGYSNRPVVALSGDGSFAMAAGELATVARVGGPTVIMLFHNQCYGWIKALQDLYHDGRYFNVDFTEPIDYTAIAQGFGLQAARVTAPKEVRPTLRRALEFGGPFLIQVDVAPEHCILPPVPPWHRAAEHGPEEKGSSSDV